MHLHAAGRAGDEAHACSSDSLYAYMELGGLDAGRHNDPAAATGAYALEQAPSLVPASEWPSMAEQQRAVAGFARGADDTDLHIVVLDSD